MTLCRAIKGMVSSVRIVKVKVAGRKGGKETNEPNSSKNQTQKHVGRKRFKHNRVTSQTHQFQLIQVYYIKATKAKPEQPEYLPMKPEEPSY